MSAVALVKRTTCPDSSSIVLGTMIGGGDPTPGAPTPPRSALRDRTCAPGW